MQSLFRNIAKEQAEDLGNRFNEIKTRIEILAKKMALQEKRVYNPFLKIIQIRHYMFNISKKELKSIGGKDVVQQREELAKEGYQIIMELRDLFFTPLKYHYYWEDTNGKIRVRELTGQDIGEYIIGSDNKRLVLNINKLQDFNSKESIALLQLQAFITKYFNLFTSNSYMSYYQSLYYARWYIIQEYKNINPGLLKKDRRSPMSFNKGHIFEALDTSIGYYFSQNPDSNNEPNQKQMEEYFFGKFLRRDNIIGSKGGDNPYGNISVKANQANVYNYNTISEQIFLLNDMFTMKFSHDIKSRLEYLYVDTYRGAEGEIVRETKEQLNQAVETIVKQLGLTN